MLLVEQVDRQTANDLQEAAVYRAAGAKIQVPSFIEARAAFDERLSAEVVAAKRDPLLEVLGL